jgi:Flp pilus assembly protein TadG
MGVSRHRGMLGVGLVRTNRDRRTLFKRDTSGTVTVEFVITLPFLIGVLAFASQYGQAMQVRNALDIATRDAARYMARAPLNGTGSTIDPIFIANAQTLINRRLGSAVEAVRFNTLTSTADVTMVDVEVDVSFPLLEWIDRGEGGTDFSSFTMEATETWPRTN